MADDRREEALHAMAAALDIVLRPEVIEGVRANAGLLEHHASNLADFPLTDDPRG